MRPDASENSQINPSTIVRAARAAGSQPHLPSGFQGRCKIATLHAGFGVIRVAPNLLLYPVLDEAENVGLGQQKFEAGGQTCRGGVDREIYNWPRYSNGRAMMVLNSHPIQDFA